MAKRVVRVISQCSLSVECMYHYHCISGRKTTSESGQDWTYQGYRGLWKTDIEIMEAISCEIVMVPL